MKEITKTIQVYSFSELSEEAREKACQQVGDSMTDNAWWYGDTYDLFVELGAIIEREFVRGGEKK